MGSTVRQSEGGWHLQERSDGETDRKHHTALSTPREKMLTPALNASRADSSKMDQGHRSGGQGKGGRAGRSISTFPCTQAPFLGEKQDIWGTAVFERE